MRLGFVNFLSLLSGHQLSVSLKRSSNRINYLTHCNNQNSDKASDVKDNKQAS